jgi:hypothetical protein
VGARCCPGFPVMAAAGCRTNLVPRVTPVSLESWLHSVLVALGRAMSLGQLTLGHAVGRVVEGISSRPWRYGGSDPQGVISEDRVLSRMPRLAPVSRFVSIVQVYSGWSMSAAATRGPCVSQSPILFLGVDTVDVAPVTRPAEHDVDRRNGGALKSQVEISGASGQRRWFGDEHQTVCRCAVHAVAYGSVHIDPFRERSRGQ